MNDRQLKELILAAKGKLPFDIYFYNARIVDVCRERIIDSGSVGIKNGIIAAVCPDFEPRATEFIDCRGMYLAPSFIDAHMHIESSKLTPFAYCEGAVPHGTGCVFFDPMQMSNTLGLKGIKVMQEMLKKNAHRKLFTAFFAVSFHPENARRYHQCYQRVQGENCG